jgi:FkbM family methyltransferase
MNDVISKPGPIPKSEIRRLIGEKQQPVVLEIGCNDGTDSREFFEMIPGVQLHCFEPDPRPIERFNAWASKLPVHNDGRELWLYRYAIGDRNGTTTLHMSGGARPGVDDWDKSSSIHRPTGHLQLSPWCTFNRTCEVKIKRLDTWLKRDDYKVIDFIWSDVQGGGADVIRGGIKTLRRTRYLYQEAYQTPMYEGELNIAEQMALLGDGWELFGIYEGCNFLAANKGMR